MFWHHSSTFWLINTGKSNLVKYYSKVQEWFRNILSTHILPALEFLNFGDWKITVFFFGISKEFSVIILHIMNIWAIFWIFIIRFLKFLFFGKAFSATEHIILQIVGKWFPFRNSLKNDPFQWPVPLPQNTKILSSLFPWWYFSCRSKPWLIQVATSPDLG